MKPHRFNTAFEWRATTGPFRRLTAAQADAYDRLGYVVLEQSLPAGAARELAAEIYRLESQSIAQSDYADEGFTSFALRLVDHSERVRTLALSASVRELARDFIGGDAIMHFDHAICKRPGGRLPFFWHQDNAYPFIEPQQHVTFWFALDDTHEDNGCLWLNPGAHRAGTLEHRSNQDGWICYEDQPAGAVPVPMKAGDLIVHSATTPHCSGPNRTAVPRQAYCLTFVPADASFMQVVDGQVTRLPCSGIPISGEAAPRGG
jgi:phytanoyl-CoA hydroxylase